MVEAFLLTYLHLDIVLPKPLYFDDEPFTRLGVLDDCFVDCNQRLKLRCGGLNRESVSSNGSKGDSACILLAALFLFLTA